MKALTIQQPYASMIASGEKWVENRTWPTRYRGPLAIHAGKASRYLTEKTLAEYPTGCIIAVAKLVACPHIDKVILHEGAKCAVGRGTRLWFEVARHIHTEGPWCWVLEDVKQLPVAIPYRGAQGLFDVPDEVLGRQPVTVNGVCK